MGLIPSDSTREANHTRTAKPSLTCRRIQNRVSLVRLRTMLCMQIKLRFQRGGGNTGQPPETIPKGLAITDGLHPARGSAGCRGPATISCSVEYNSSSYGSDFSEGKPKKHFPPLLPPKAQLGWTKVQASRADWVPVSVSHVIQNANYLPICSSNLTASQLGYFCYFSVCAFQGQAHAGYRYLCLYYYRSVEKLTYQSEESISSPCLKDHPHLLV